MSSKIKFALCLFLIVIFVAGFGYQLGAWPGFPKGVDAYARITRIVYILDFYPHVSWQYHWANGMPTFKSEAPLFYFLGAILAKVLSLSTDKPLVILGFLTFVMIGLGVFGFVKSFTKRYLPGLLAAILAVSSFALWSWMIHGGVYPRIFGVGLSTIAFWQAARFLVRLKNTSSFPKWPFFWLVIFLSASITGHLLMGAFVTLAIGILFLSFPLPRLMKIKYGFFSIMLSFLISAFFLLPAILNFGGGSSRFIGVISPVNPVPLDYLLGFHGIGPFVLPILVLFFLFNLIRFKKNPSPGEENVCGSIWLSPLFMFLLFSTYSLIGYTGLSGRYYYINGFIPISGILFMTLYGSILIGILSIKLEERNQKIFPIIETVGIIAIGVLSMTINAPKIVEDSRHNIIDTSAPVPTNDVYRMQNALKFTQEDDLNHRFAAFDANEAVWFNAIYKIPQVRDYYGQGILYPDWRYWFEQAVWVPEEFSMAEARAAFDWFAVRWFSTYESDENVHNYEEFGPQYFNAISVETFLSQSGNRYFKEADMKLASYGRVGYGGIQELIEIENPSPILSVSNAPTVLYIGRKVDYNYLFSNLTFNNYSSQKLVPIRGKSEILDKYSLDDLKNYDILFLYHYKLKNLTKATKMLSDYLGQGGNIIWEGYDSPDIPELSPLSKIEQIEIKGGQWGFEVASDELTQPVNFSAFSPPIYIDTAWKAVSGRTKSKNGTKVILSTGGKPLMITMSLGKGKIVWIGFNFLYHINDYKNLEEEKFLERIFSFLTPSSGNGEPISGDSKFVNPEKREIQIQGEAKGVLFKESYFSQWQAYSVNKSGQKRKLSIDLAGPGMMYASLGGQKGIEKVVFQYHLSLIDKLGIFLSFFSLLLLFGIVFFFNKVKSLASHRIAHPFSRKAKSWWNDEEV